MSRWGTLAARALGATGAAALMLFVAVPQASAAATSLSASGTGAQEVPPAEATDTVAASFDIDAQTGRISYRVAFHGSEPAVASHIHKGAAGAAGPVVVPLEATVVNGMGTGTVTVDKTLAAAILADPGAYYVNVHTKSHSAGAARGQLGATAMAPTAVNAGNGGQFAASHAAGGGRDVNWALLGGGLLVGVGGFGVMTARRRHS